MATTLGRKHVSKETKKRVNVGVLARFEAKPGKEAELESLLRNGVALVEKEPATTEWFAIKIAPTTYGIFDVFPDEAGRQAHFDGEFTALLFSKLPELQALQPKIELIDVVATTINKKIPIWD
uniref:Antibiotic biosynthesis monooxygenase n=1 Tax=Desmonostoc muscorum LEGE 12446 TaxID=1828758 RepID=A0A8J7CWF9_DESMC